MTAGVDTTFLVQLEVRESEGHDKARAYLAEGILVPGHELAIAPQVLEEFVHVVTDPARFERPLSTVEALEKADFWWQATEIRPVYPNHQSVLQFLEWMRTLRLGRKRIHDTLLAATYLTNGIADIVTSDREGFALFGVLEVRDPLLWKP